MDWKQALKSRLAAGPDPKRSDQELKDEEMELFTKYYLEWKGGRRNATTSYMNIPRFYYREPFPSALEGEQPGKFKSPGRAPRGPTWTDEETRVLLGHWNTLLVQRRIQNMPTNSDLYAVLAKKMAEEGFLRTRIQCNNRVRDLRKAYRKAKDAMGKAGAVPVRCRFFRELDEICGGEAEGVPSSANPATRLLPATTVAQPGPSWEPVPEVSWKVEEDSETEAPLAGAPQEPLQGVLKIKVESELEEEAAFPLPLQPVSCPSSSTAATVQASEEGRQPALQEPDSLLPARPAAAHAPQPVSPSRHSEQRLEAGIQDRVAGGRPSCDSEAGPRAAAAAVGRMAQGRAKRRRAREATVDRLLEEMRAGREAMDTTLRLFLEQQRSFQNSLIREMRLARREQRRATEAELHARQEEWRQQRTRHPLDGSRTDAEMGRLRQELSLLRQAFMDFVSASGAPSSSSPQRTPIPARQESADPPRPHGAGGAPAASQAQAPLPDPPTLGLPAEDEILLQKLREESRAVFLQRKSRELLDNEELQNLWFLLDKHQTPPMMGDEAMINYESFLKVGEKAGSKCKQFFTAKVFAKLLHNDAYGRISIMQFFNYVMRKVWLYQTRIGLSLYDVAGQGYLRESDLENYILELIPTLPQLDGLEKSFYSFYVCTAVRKFFFFLDPLRTGKFVLLLGRRRERRSVSVCRKIKIQDILACSFLDDLLELRDEELSKESQETNWFSAPSALRVYGQYLNLDKDHNGMLSKEELSRYGTGTLTNIFLDRVFQECLTYDGEMDYKTYLDFVLALENRKEPAALQYIFKLLDIENKGYLNVFSLNYFFRAIQEQMKIHGQEPVSFQDVKDEIFDMVKPKDPYKISLQDLINSSQGDTVSSILIDLNGFWTYENREVLVASDNDNTADLDDT
ncbi:hypothetical protein lerEdw1_004903 [Lerista edwardsae]|nr:hypothetical protein lerEdw1_004903 [Lerista edwardsae]